MYDSSTRFVNAPRRKPGAIDHHYFRNVHLSSSTLQALPALGHIGAGLTRPECVLTTRAGDIYTSDWRGGVAHIRPDGSQTLYRADAIDGQPLKPNGIALNADGSFLLAQLGAGDGGVYRLTRDGELTPFLRTVDGLDLPPTNFVVADAAGRTWITVSTRRTPRALGYRKDCDDGFIVLVDGKGARIVADGLGYTNECAVHPSGLWLYVNETFTRRLSRFPLRADGSLGAKEVVTEFGRGTFPDGLVFDAEGGAWIVSIVSNRVIRVLPDGTQQTFLQDADDNHLAWVEAAYQASDMGRPHLDQVKSQRLKNISSIAFGGSDLRQGYLGCLLGDHVTTLHMPVAGQPPVHWEYPL
jgi:sugar lactone lactonase YvrE